jgi:hypothetical protein
LKITDYLDHQAFSRQSSIVNRTSPHHATKQDKKHADLHVVPPRNLKDDATSGQLQGERKKQGQNGQRGRGGGTPEA